jgi:predicted Zn-dependent protease
MVAMGHSGMGWRTAIRFVSGGRRRKTIVCPTAFLFLWPLYAGSSGPALAQTDEQAKASQQAAQLMAEGRYEAAIPIYRELVNALPDNPGLAFDLGAAEHMAGREREAIPLLARALKAQPDDLRIRDMLASALMNVGRFQEAAAQYREMAARLPENAKVWYALGMSYQEMAGADFERLQKIAPSSPYVGALVAETQVKAKQYGDASRLFRQASQALPGLHGLHAALANLYRQTGHPDWAAREDALEAALPAPDCTAHAAECEFAAGHDVPLAAGPASTAETIYWQTKAAKELALQAFLRLGQLPESAEMHRLKAEIARGEGQHMEAVREWRAALALEPGNWELELELAESLLSAADYRNALEKARELLKAQPHSAELNFIAGESLLRLEQPEESAPYLRSAAAADPKLLPAQASLGLALARTGKQSEAIPHLVRALELDQDGSLHFQLAAAYRATGQPDKARAAMAQYQEIEQRLAKGREEAAPEPPVGPPQ